VHTRTSMQCPLTCNAVQLVPCVALAFISHPKTRHAFIFRILWAFCVYVEAVSVAPQVVMMQQNKTVEKFTGHYVFFLGLSRFFSCAHWILQMFDSRGTHLWTVRLLAASSILTHCPLTWRVYPAVNGLKTMFAYIVGCARPCNSEWHVILSVLC
jgi:hypothetical protein